MSWFSRMFGKLTNPKSKYVTPGLEDGTGEGPPASDVAEQAERVARVEERLRGEGVPFNPDMEPVEAESTVQVRDRHEVADGAHGTSNDNEYWNLSGHAYDHNQRPAWK